MGTKYKTLEISNVCEIYYRHYCLAMANDMGANPLFKCPVLKYLLFAQRGGALNLIRLELISTKPLVYELRVMFKNSGFGGSSTYCFSFGK